MPDIAPIGASQLFDGMFTSHIAMLQSNMQLALNVAIAWSKSAIADAFPGDTEIGQQMPFVEPEHCID